jgi:DNA repair exonuclease SbcCD ATPase subunit
MKKSILMFVASLCISSSVFTSCNTSSEKLENAKSDVKDAKEDLHDANEEYLVDVENYKKETADKISANNQSIAEFKARKASDKKEAREEYNEKIAKLEAKNSDMQKKMDDYKTEGKENWEKFKTEFSHDMDELGNAFKDLTVNNVK